MLFDHGRGSEATIQLVIGSHVFKFGGYSLAKGMGAGKYIASDTFRVGGYDWIIAFYPDGKNSEDNSIYVSVFMVLASYGSEVRALFDLALLDQSGKGQHQVHSHTEPYTLKCKGSMWGQERFLRRASLEASDYLKDDCLSMHCKISVVRHFIISTPSHMGQNLKYLLETEMGCDVVLRVGDKTFKAHKVIFAAHSDVFRAQFLGLLGNPNIDELELKEVEPSIFKVINTECMPVILIDLRLINHRDVFFGLQTMLLFIYSDTLPDTMSTTSTHITEQLLAAADRFGIDRLKQLCEAKLGEEINVDTVATMLGFARKRYCSQLKFLCLKYAIKCWKGAHAAGKV